MVILDADHPDIAVSSSTARRRRKAGAIVPATTARSRTGVFVVFFQN
jgi:hypothetical protein